jgi:hypothetical protein
MSKGKAQRAEMIAALKQMEAGLPMNEPPFDVREFVKQIVLQDRRVVDRCGK